MGKIEERILQLRGEIEDLRIIADQSSIKHQTSLRYFDMLDNLDLRTEANLKIFYEFLKESSSYFREYLRDKIAVISKVSPRIGDNLNKHHKSYEDKTRELLKEYENVTFRELNKKFKNLEFQNRSVELFLLASGLKNTVEYSYECIIDAIFFD